MRTAPFHARCQTHSRAARPLLRGMLLALCALAFALLAGCSAADADNGNTDAQSSTTAAQTPDDGAGATDGLALPSTVGALQVKGAQLCDAQGNPVQLRGVSTHGLAWFPQYVNQELMGELRRDWNANVVRLALYTAEYGGYATDGDKQALYGLVRQGVDYATNADLYVIVDWHVLGDLNPLTHQDQAAEFFDRISSDLATHDNVIYEICNEPNGGTSWDDVKAYAEEIIPIIRANDPDAVVLVGTPNWSQEVDKPLADPLAFDNVLYTLHFYAATHKDDLRGALAAAHDAGLPLFVSEFGICDASGNGQIDYGSADAWIELLDQCGISYVCWNLSNKDESSSLLKPDCAKASGITSDDLSEAGAWLWEVLQRAA